jgi:asparaginyl-tRNA synthetase
MDITPLKWYIDLRKNGSTPTAGAGLGFDRLVRICTGMENIRDAVCFPVAYQECKL